jgi:hypothetical protein
VVSDLESLKSEEQEAWSALVSYIDFTDKCKRRIYKNQKLFAPVPVPEVEAEFTRRVRRWEKAQLRLQEYEELPATMSKEYNGTRTAANGSRQPPSKTRLQA